MCIRDRLETAALQLQAGFVCDGTKLGAHRRITGARGIQRRFKLVAILLDHGDLLADVLRSGDVGTQQIAVPRQDDQILLGPPRRRYVPTVNHKRDIRGYQGHHSEQDLSLIHIFPRLRDRRASLRLYRYHARPLAADPTHLLHLVERLAHADQSHTAAGRVQNHVGQFPGKLLPHFVTHRLLAFNAIRFFQRGHVVPAGRPLVLCDVFAAIGNQPVNLDDFRPKRPALHHISHWCVRRHHDHGSETRCGRVRRQSAARIPSRWRRQRFGAELLGSRHRRRHPSRLERAGGVQTRCV